MYISPSLLKIFDAFQCGSDPFSNSDFNSINTHHSCNTYRPICYWAPSITYPLSSVTRTFTPLKSVRKWVDVGAGVICRSESLGFSGRPTLTTKLTVVPLPKPSLSIQMWPSIRFTNLQHHKQQFNMKRRPRFLKQKHI